MDERYPIMVKDNMMEAASSSFMPPEPVFDEAIDAETVMKMSAPPIYWEQDDSQRWKYSVCSNKSCNGSLYIFRLNEVVRE